MITPSAPAASPKLQPPVAILPSAYCEESLRAGTSSTLTFSNLYPQISQTAIPKQDKTAVSVANPCNNNHDINDTLAPYESLDDVIERYKAYAAGAIGLAVLTAISAAILAVSLVFIGFAFTPILYTAADPCQKNTNFTLVFGTIGTMIALYQTDSMKTIMNATVAKMEGLWNWDNMSNTTHEFLTFNVAFTLSLVAGCLAQSLVGGAIEVADQRARNKPRMA